MCGGNIFSFLFLPLKQGCLKETFVIEIDGREKHTNVLETERGQEPRDGVVYVTDNRNICCIFLVNAG